MPAARAPVSPLPRELLLGICPSFPWLHPLKDFDVRLLLAQSGGKTGGAYDVILMDVDNGPWALSTRTNRLLWDAKGIATLARTLPVGGTLVVWSSGHEPLFERRLADSGFSVEARNARAPAAKRAFVRCSLSLASEHSHHSVPVNWLNPYLAAGFEETRNAHVARAGNDLHWAFQKTKPWVNSLSPGCQLCGDGQW